MKDGEEDNEVRYVKEDGVMKKNEGKDGEEKKCEKLLFFYNVFIMMVICGLFEKRFILSGIYDFIMKVCIFDLF